MSPKSIKYMLLMLCSALKIYLFFKYSFLARKSTTFKKSYEIGISKVFFSSKEKDSLKKEKYVRP